jgi:hypothetical protein
MVLICLTVLKKHDWLRLPEPKVCLMGSLQEAIRQVRSEKKENDIYIEIWLLLLMVIDEWEPLIGLKKG